MRDVIVTYEVFRNICEYTSQFASFKMPREDWVESMGYLFCVVPKDTDTDYIIKDAVGITQGSDIYVEMDYEQVAKIEKLEADRPGMFLGGWFHTHPGLTLFYSDVDVKNQSFYQQGNEDGLGIVFDLNIIDEDFIGFKIFRNDSKNSTKYHEVKYKLHGFTEENLKEALDYIGGISDQIIHNLAINYGFASGDKYEIEDLEVDSTENPVEDGEKVFRVAKVFVFRKDWEKASMNMRKAAILYQMGEEYEWAADSYFDVAKFSALKGDIILAEYVLSLVEDLIDEEKIEAADYYRGKLLYNKGIAYKSIGNLSRSAELMRLSLEFYDKDEDFLDSFESIYERSQLLEEMKDEKRALDTYKLAEKYAKILFDEGEDESRKWDEIISEISDKINELKSKTKGQGLSRVI